MRDKFPNRGFRLRYSYFYAAAADGIYDTGMIVRNYFTGGLYVVDILQTADGAYYLTDLVPLSAAA